MAEESDVDLDKRKEFIADMESFIEKECNEVGELLTHLSWTPDQILKSKSLVECPHNAGHWVPESSLKHHTAECRLKKMGLSAEEVETELRNDDFFYEKADLVGKVQLDEGLLNRILWNHAMEHGEVHQGHHEMPVSGADWWVKLSPQERLAVYRHCVAQLQAQGKMANVEKDDILTTDWERIVKKGMLEQGDKKPKSRLELHAMLRDLKRRRQSYRAKNVHVTKKSYTEIIREVILNQMEIMMPSAEVKEQKPEEEKDISQPRHLSTPSSSRNRSRSPKRRRRDRSHYLERRDDRSHSSESRHIRSYRDNKNARRSRSRSRPRYRSRSRSRSRSKSRSKSPSIRRDRGSRQKNEESFEEGELESEGEGESSPHHHKKKKKSSKHKKHKHKKHKSKSNHSDSD